MKIVPKIVFEDNHIIVVIKPHNIAVQEDETIDIKSLEDDKNSSTGNI